MDCMRQSFADYMSRPFRPVRNVEKANSEIVAVNVKSPLQCTNQIEELDGYIIFRQMNITNIGRFRVFTVPQGATSTFRNNSHFTH